MWIASRVQQDFGNVDVSNVIFKNATGKKIRAKLFRHRRIDASHKAPGIVYIHGYQSNRENSDPFCIELSRRGVVALCIDAIGRGNSDPSGFPGESNYDGTFGTTASIEYLKHLSFVDIYRVGVMGNSIGGELAYEASLRDPSLKAAIFTGFAFDKRATASVPKNMLMLFGDKDEYRNRMLGSKTIGLWIESDMVKQVFHTSHPTASKTWGRFEDGTARRVEFPNGIHLKVSHSSGPVASSLLWIRQALSPEASLWKDPKEQIWPIKEWATSAAMLLGLFSIIPLLSLLLKLRFFSPLRDRTMTIYMPSARERRFQLLINTLLMWLYPALILILFAVHIYVVRIDRVFPMMITNGIVFWFFVINGIGIWLFLRWRKKQGWSFEFLGLSAGSDTGRFFPRTAILAALLFSFVCGQEHILEQLFNVDYRFVFPFASDWTAARAWVAVRYFPFILIGFMGMGILLHVRLRRPERSSRLFTFLDWSLYNTAALIGPLLILLAVQYIPLYTANVIPLVGPGGGLVSFIMNLFHIVGVLSILVPISNFCFMETRTPYLGAFLSASITTWMFATSQVIAPLPV
jgi:pimeloyl-ACP methyl ester carboxylesterase